MLDYYGVLAELHQTRRPHTYVEIGVEHGKTLALAGEDTLCIGVDPEPAVPEAISRRCHIEKMTSDDFFAGPRLAELLGEQVVDMAFIDGMHLFEFALRDFMNLEARSGAGSLIAVHDCLPRDPVMSSRERTTLLWAGDVWKLVVCLLDQRPELEITLLDAAPSGLCLISGLQPGDTTLHDNYSAMVERYLPLGFEDWVAAWPDTVGRLTNGGAVAGPHVPRRAREGRPPTVTSSVLDWLDEERLACPRAGLLSVADDRDRKLESKPDRFVLAKTRRVIDWYATCFAEDPPQRVLDLCVGKGGGVVLFSELWRPERLVAVDIAAGPIPALADYIERCDLAASVKPIFGVDQADAAALRSVIWSEFGATPLDLVVDDGSRSPEATRATFWIALSFLRPGGVYVIEDWAPAGHQGDSKDDGLRPGEPTTTLIALEISTLCASRPDLIESVEITSGLLVVHAGDRMTVDTDFALEANSEIAHLRDDLAQKTAQLSDVYRSTSWRVSAPVRWAGRLAGRHR